MDIKDPDRIGLEQDICIHGSIKRGVKWYPALFKYWILAESGNPETVSIGAIGCIVYSIVRKIFQLTGDVGMCLTAF